MIFTIWPYCQGHTIAEEYTLQVYRHQLDADCLQNQQFIQTQRKKFDIKIKRRTK